MKLVNRLDNYFVLMRSSNETTPMTKMHDLEMELNQRHFFVLIFSAMLITNYIDIVPIPLLTRIAF